ncbi:hypothetical protein [Rhodococcus koreensis]|uniref:hypothetical protein n=1 Tax=Rhodococcus koreensis TaxID=99653 RepID=UPI0036716CF6
MAVTLIVDLGTDTPELGNYALGGTPATLNDEPVTLTDQELRGLMRLLAKHGQGEA